MPEITGTEGRDSLEGTSGDDVINALGADDVVYVSLGNDVLHGGAGLDSLQFRPMTGNPLYDYQGFVRYVFTEGRVTESLGVYSVTFDGFERIFFAPYNTGPSEVDASAWAQAANPGSQLFLSVGSDSRLIGSNFDDYLEASGVNTFVDAGSGMDRVLIYTDNGSIGPITIKTTNGVTRVTQSPNVSVSAPTSVDIVNAEYIGLTPQRNPSTYNPLDASGSEVSIYFFDYVARDTVIGSPKDDIFYNRISDLPNGWDDTDVFTGGLGADQFLFVNGIASFDKTFITDFSADDIIDLNSNSRSGFLVNTFIGTAAFSGKAGEYRYEAAGGRTLVQYDGNGDRVADGTLTIQNGEFRLVTKTTANGVHALVIDPASVALTATEGDDTLIGTSGPETLDGRGGNDTLIGGPGGDRLIGGEGTDTASYGDDIGAVFVNLSLGRGYANSSFGDTYESIENVVGTAFNDFLIGDPGVNRLEGGAGNDTIIGGLGADVLIGGPGTDLLSFEDNSGTVFVNLLTGMGYNNAAQGDTFSGFENVVGGLFDDTLIGDNGANRLDGAMGADTLVGNGGADTFVFKHAPGSSSGFVHPNSNPNVDTLFDFVSGEDKLEISASAFGGGLTAGSLAAGAFVVGTAAGDADDRFVYDQANGRLYFDADGSGGGAQVLMALLPNHDAITASDFAIV
ncbi:calcium-binding protein [Tsuneonella sp. HG222]